MINFAIHKYLTYYISHMEQRREPQQGENLKRYLFDISYTEATGGGERKIKPQIIWDYEMFVKVMALAAADGVYITPGLRPDILNITGFRQKVLALIGQKTKVTGNEYGQIGFVDPKDGLTPEIIPELQWGAVQEGGSMGVSIDMEHSGRGRFNWPVIVLHSHPVTWLDKLRIPGVGNRFGLHLSPDDYISFLISPELQTFGVTWRGNALIVLKTQHTADTLENQSPEDVEREVIEMMRNTGAQQRIDRIQLNIVSPDRYRLFTKEVCLRYGMLLYYAREDSSMARLVLVDDKTEFKIAPRARKSSR